MCHVIALDLINSCNTNDIISFQKYNLYQIILFTCLMCTLIVQYWSVKSIYDGFVLTQNSQST